MSNTKIFGANHGIATANVIPDNNATALVIQDTAGEQFMKITTTDGAEQLELGVGAGDGGEIKNAGLIIREVDGSLPELQICDEMGFIGDTDTQMRLKTANTISFKTAGTERMAIGPTAVMIGTDIDDITSPNSLHVRNDSVAAQACFQRDSGKIVVEASGANTTLNSNVDFRVQAGSAIRQCIASGSGNVGFGTCSATAEVETVGHLGTELTDSGGTASVSTSGSSTTLTGVNTAFTTDFHVGAAIKVGTVTTTVTQINSDTELILEDAINTSSTGVACKRDGGELFAVKTGDSKSVMAVNSTGVLTLSSSSGVTSSAGNIAIGDASILDAIEEDGVLNTIISQRGSGSWALSSAANNIIIGFGSGLDMTSAQRNVAIGTYALDDVTSTQNTVAIGTNCGRKSGNDCVYIGHNAGDAATGAHNTVIGKGAFSATCSGTNNVAIGRDAMGAFTGSDSIAIGKEALDATSSTRAVSVGYQSLTGLTATTTDNTAVGHQAGDGLDDGNKCLFLGSGADTTDADGDNQIVIGYNAAGQGPDTVMLGNSDIGGLHCYTTSVTSPSDSRIKNNVENSSLGLDFINALRPVKYQKKHPSEFPEEIREARWADQEVTRTRSTDDGGTEEYTETIPADTKAADWQPRTEYGLIAQEVKAAMDAHGGTDWQGHTVLLSGMEALSYGNLVTVLVKAVQELSAQNESLAARITTLEGGD